MEILEASVQYGDFTGEAKGDANDSGGLDSLAKSHGIGGHVVGASLYSGENGYMAIAIYTTDTNDFDKIEAAAKANGGKITVKKHDLEGVSIEKFLKAFKRFDVALRYRYPNVRVMEYED